MRYDPSVPRDKGKKGGRQREPIPPQPPPITPPNFASIAGKPGLSDPIRGYLSGWWSRKGAAVVALADDVLLYACFLIFVSAIHFLLNLAAKYGGYAEIENHRELHKWGFLSCDLVIILALIRKLVVVLLLTRH
jgi:hypothetical protein